MGGRLTTGLGPLGDWGWQAGHLWKKLRTEDSCSSAVPPGKAQAKGTRRLQCQQGGRKERGQIPSGSSGLTPPPLVPPQLTGVSSLSGQGALLACAPRPRTHSNLCALLSKLLGVQHHSSEYGPAPEEGPVLGAGGP